MIENQEMTEDGETTYKIREMIEDRYRDRD